MLFLPGASVGLHITAVSKTNGIGPSSREVEEPPSPEVYHLNTEKISQLLAYMTSL
jgi:hypothetical protein